MITFANHNIHHTCASLAVPPKKTKARTTTFFRERASLDLSARLARCRRCGTTSATSRRRRWSRSTSGRRSPPAAAAGTSTILRRRDRIDYVRVGGRGVGGVAHGSGANCGRVWVSVLGIPTNCCSGALEEGPTQAARAAKAEEEGVALNTFRVRRHASGALGPPACHLSGAALRTVWCLVFPIHSPH